MLSKFLEGKINLVYRTTF